MNNLRLLLVVFSLIFVLPLSSRAEGLSGMDMLELSSVTRNASMGGAGMPLIQDIGALDVNPAGLSGISKNQVLLAHTSGFENASYEYASYGTRILRNGAGISVYMMHQGVFDETDMTGEPIGSLSPMDLAVQMGYSYQVKTGSLRNSFGFSAKYIYRSLSIYHASAVAGDVGYLLSTTILKKDPLSANNFNFGVSLKNFGTTIKFVNDSAPLPMSLNAGMSFSPVQALEHDLNFALGFSDFLVDRTWTASAGAEYTYKDLLSLRMGYVVDPKSGNSFTFGVGMSQQKAVSYSIDLGLVPNPILGNVFQIGLGLEF